MRLFKLVSVAVLAALLASCAQLPTQISVETGPELELPSARDFVYYSPPGPALGSSAQEIVNGFLNAGTAPQNDYQIARQFLSTQAASRWRPESQVLVRSGAPKVTQLSEAALSVEIPISAKLDANGRFTAATSGRKETLRFQLIDESGEWRISSAPNLTVVTQPVFGVVFQAYPVYYLDAGYRLLVPDLRWFPSRISTATRLVNSLLAGPTDWLGGAVRSAIPAGTRLTIDAVRVIDGVALVDFDANALGADGQQRSLMLAQLQATLSQLSAVQSVTVSVNSNPQEIDFISLLAPPALGSLLASNESGVFRITGSSAETIAGSANAIATTGANRFDMSQDASQLVLGSPSGTYLAKLRGFRSDLTLIDDRPDLLGPQFDFSSHVWSISPGQPSEIRVFDSDGQPVQLLNRGLPASWLSFALSPEGARMASITVDGESAKLNVAGIVRDAQGQPRTLLESKSIETSGKPISVAWSDANTLVVLELFSSGATSAVRHPLSGPKVTLSNPPVSGTGVLATGGGAVTYLRSQNGEIWALTGTSWRRIFESSLAFALAD